jgi:RHS repeat-associated protein
MKKLRFLSLTLIFALLCNSTVLAFHAPPWDTGHNSFSGDPGDSNPDPGTGEGCNSCPCTSKSASPVEEATGNFIYNLRVLTISGLGPPINLTLTYNSQDRRRGPFGTGWVHPYEQRVIETTDEVKIYAICSQANGKRERFAKNPDSSYTSPSYLFSTLSKQPDKTFTLSHKNGEVHRFDAQGQLTAIVDRNGNTLSFTYDNTGFMTAITDASGRSVTLTKGADGRVQSMIDPANRTFRFEYDSSGNLTRYTDPLGNARVYQYDTANNITAMVDPRGNTLMRLTYDSLGRVSQHVEGAETWTYTYSPSAKQTTKRDSQNNTWTFNYNDNGNIIKTTDPLGRTEQSTLDAKLNVTQFTDKNGRTINYTYDERGNQLTVTDALNNVRTMTYEPVFNRPLTVRDAAGNTTRFEYDARGNLIKTTNALGQATQFDYDAKGQLTKTTNALGKVYAYSYDAFGNVIRTTDPLGNSKTATFDVLGKQLTSTDAEGRTTRSVYDNGERLIQIVNAIGGVMSKEYDIAGNLTAITTATGAKTTFQFDSLNRMISTTNALGQITTYTYDRRNRVATKTQPKGQTVTYTYDALGRLSRTTTPDNTINYTYDAVDNQLSVTDGDSSLTFLYDAVNRVTEARTAATAGQPGTVIRYTYDALGKRKTMTDPTGGVTNYIYDSLQRLSSLTDPSGLAFTVSYDPLSERIAMARPFGLSTTYAYDDAGRLTSMVHQGGPGILSFNYSHDRVGNRLTKTEAGGVYQYAYDQLYRLTSATSSSGTNPESYGYDAVGNITRSQTSTYSYDTANRLTSDSTFDYQYDANGNLTRKTERATGKATNFTYDAENQLTRIDFPNSTNSTYRYDGLGRRIERNINGVITQHVYDERRILFDYSAGAVTARYAYGINVDEVLSVRRGGADVILQSDPLGSVIRAVDQSGTKASYTYATFGRIISESGVRQVSFAFQGREFDTESQQYYFRARYYSPDVGRFTQEDPIRWSGGSNFYQFVGDNPVNAIDPLGLYGTNDCSYYSERCAESGGNYYCKTAPYFCNLFPKYPDPLPDENNDFEGWTRCARKCLQDCDRRKAPTGTCSAKPDPSTDSFWSWKHFSCHAECYTKCAAWGVGDALIPPAY